MCHPPVCGDQPPLRAGRWRRSPFAVVGGDPQDLSFEAANDSKVRVGARTVIREHVTISRATRTGASTEIGDDCFLMAASHVAHDCHIGDRVVLANAVLLAGHVQIGDRAFLGGGAVVHQFCRIGESAMIGGGALARDPAIATRRHGRTTVVGAQLSGRIHFIRIGEPIAPSVADIRHARASATQTWHESHIGHSR